MQEACRRDQALQLKEAELLAAKQSVRSAVAEHMKSAPASELRVVSYESHHRECMCLWVMWSVYTYSVYLFLGESSKLVS